MLRLLEEEIKAGLKERQGDSRKVHASIATGLLAEPFIREYVNMVQKSTPGRSDGFWTENDFFGEKITVSGLLTGQDLYRQLAKKRFR